MQRKKIHLLRSEGIAPSPISNISVDAQARYGRLADLALNRKAEPNATPAGSRTKNTKISNKDSANYLSSFSSREITQREVPTMTSNTLRIDRGNGSRIIDYRIQGTHVESRTVYSTGVAGETGWQRVTADQLSSHVMSHTIVAKLATSQDGALRAPSSFQAKGRISR